MRRLLATPESSLREIAERYGPICRLGGGPFRLVVVGSPSLIHELLMQPNDRYQWGSRLSPFRFVIGPTSLLVSDGAEHRRRRGAVQHVFSRRRLNRWLPMIVERTDAAIDQLLATSPSPTMPVDLSPFGRHLVIDIVVRALFGERLVQHTDEIDRGFRRIEAYLSSPFYRQVPHPIPFTARAGVRADRKRQNELLDTAIADSRRAGPPADDSTGDVLDALVHGSDLTDQEIRDQVKSLIGAGYNTTASSLAWMLWETVLHPDLWARLGAEADRVLPAPGSTEGIDDQSFAALELTQRAMRETLRVHPASGVAARTAVADTIIGGHRIPKGSFILWSPYLAGRDPTAWPDPERFDPDRFLGLEPVQKALSDEGWVPFGKGPRMCIGFALAQMELTLITARLAQRLALRPTAPTPPPPVGLIVSEPDGGTPMLVAAR